MITVTCPGCQAALKVPETLSGRKAKCNNCAVVFQVPQLSSAIAPRPSSAPPAKGPTPASPRDDDAPRPRRRPEADDLEVEEDAPRRKPSKKSGSPVLVLAVVGVVALFLLAATGGAVWFFVFRGSGPMPGLKWMPNNSQVLISIRVGDIRTSQAFKDVQSAIPTQFKDMIEQGMKESGGDWKDAEDIASVTVGLPNIEANMAGQVPNVVICMITTKAYKPEDMIAKAKNKVFSSKQVGPHMLYDAGDIAFAVVDSNTIVMGPATAVQPVLERNADPTLSQTMRDALGDVSMSKAVVVVFEVPVSASRELAKKSGMGGPNTDLAGLPEKLETVAIEVGIAKDVDVRTVITFKEAAPAETLAKLTNAQLVQAAAITPPEFKSMVGSIQASASGRKTTITGTVTTGPITTAMRGMGNMGLPQGFGFGQQTKKVPPQVFPDDKHQPPPFKQDPVIIPEFRNPGTWTVNLTQLSADMPR
jgi:hypothetical protein